MQKSEVLDLDFCILHSDLKPKDQKPKTRFLRFHRNYIRIAIGYRRRWWQRWIAGPEAKWLRDLLILRKYNLLDIDSRERVHQMNCS
jgi:hypothetical protein